MGNGTNEASVQAACASESPQPANPWAALRQERRGPLTVILMAACIGLGTGMLEVMALACEWLFHPATGLGDRMLNRHYLWMIPLDGMLIFGACGLVLSPAVRIWPRAGARLAVYLLVGLAGLELLLELPGLGMRTYLLLACGIAAVVGPFVEVCTRQVRLNARNVVPLLVAAVAALGCLSHGRVLLAEHLVVKDLPAAEPGAPNVVLIVLNTAPADASSVGGRNPYTSPELSRLAREGVRFDQASAAARQVLPPIASIDTCINRQFIGGSEYSTLAARYSTLADVFGSRGYVTAEFVAARRFYRAQNDLVRGFIHTVDMPVSAYEVFRSGKLGRRLVKVIDRAREKLSEVRGDPSRLLGVFGGDFRAGWRERSQVNAARINRDALDWMSVQGQPFFAFVHHDECIDDLDAELGRLFDELDRRGLLRNTVVFVTADRGEHSRARGGMFGPMPALVSQESGVPLLVIAPGRVPAGQVVSAPASLRDLPTTVLDLAGLGRESAFPGRSLARFWRTTGSGP